MSNFLGRNDAMPQLERLSDCVYIPLLLMGKAVGRAYASIRSGLAGNGTPIENSDLWIAAHGQARDITRVTLNVKEFDRVEGIKRKN